MNIDGGIGMKITDKILLIASGDSGIGITNKYDCNVYLVDCGNKGYVLIDCGVGLETERIKAQFEKSGYMLNDCLGILITHAHADHSGGSSWLTKYTGAKAYAFAESSDYISNGDTKAISLDIAISAGIYPNGYKFSSCPVNKLKDGEIFMAGDLSFCTVSTPGHCNGHCGYLVEVSGIKTLFSGDCIFHGGSISLQPTWDCSIYEYAKSIDRLAEIEFDALIPSHFGFYLGNGKEAVLTAQKAFKKLSIPS